MKAVELNAGMKTINRASAEKQVALLNDFYDVDLNFLIESVRPRVEQRLLGLTKHIMRGRLSISQNGDSLSVVQYLERPISGTKAITYKEAGSLVQLALMRAGENDSSSDAVAGALSELGADFFSSKKMHPRDRSTMEDLAQYFLLV